MSYITIAAEGFIGTPKLKETPIVDFGDPLSYMQIRRNRASNLFGKVRNNNTKNHQGFDYYALEGTEVYAVANGEVVYIVDPPLGDYGKQIVIKIDNSKYYAFYAHLLQIDVKKGDIVKKGDTIGKTGITGNAKTFRGLDQHLHFECRTAAKNGRSGIAIHSGHTVGFADKINDNGMLMSTYGCIRVYNSAMEKLGELYTKYKKEGKKIFCYIEDYNVDINDVYSFYEFKRDGKDRKRNARSKKQ